MTDNTQITPSSSPELRDCQILTQNKNITTMWLLLLTQLFYCFMYGFFIRINVGTVGGSERFVWTAFMLLLVIGGFGLVFARPCKLVWTSIGFNLLIASLAIQNYFLISAFWIKAAIYLGNSAFSIDTFTIALVPDDNTALANTTFNQAIKCALACIVAWTYLKGRAGLLEAYVVAVFGSIVYELARQTCLNNFPYQLGSIKIFLFGGVFGLLASLVMARIGREPNLAQHPNNHQTRESNLLNLLGLLLCWCLFPLLTRDTSLPETLPTQQTRVFSLVLAMSSAAVLSTVLGYLQYGFRLVGYSVIGAGVAVLSSSAYMSNPVYGVVFGLAAAIAQIVFVAVWDRFEIKVDPHAFVFVGQGFLGIFFQAINRQAVETNPNMLTFSWTSSKRPEYILGNGAITIGMALLLGFILGALFTCCAYHEEIDQYSDWPYWVQGDGLNRHGQLVVKKEEEIVTYETYGGARPKNGYV